MRFTLLSLLLIILQGCTQDFHQCCHPDDLVIADIYLAEDFNESRFICVSGIKGFKVESAYIHTYQMHKYKIEDSEIKIEYYHNLMAEEVGFSEKFKNDYFRIIDLSFGKLVLSDLNEKKSKVNKHALRSIMDDIKINEFSNSKICFTCDGIEHIRPIDLYGSRNSEEVTCYDKREIKVSMDNLSKGKMIDIMYGNRDVLSDHLVDGDLISFYANDSDKTLVRSYIVTSSSIGDTLDLSICNMGPKRFGFECIYINSNYDLRN